MRRTVKARRSPSPRRRMTSPSKIWMRSRVPSTTFRWTRTESPGSISGRSSRNCASSTARTSVATDIVVSSYRNAIAQYNTAAAPDATATIGLFRPPADPARPRRRPARRHAGRPGARGSSPPDPSPCEERGSYPHELYPHELEQHAQRMLQHALELLEEARRRRAVQRAVVYGERHAH